jgi:hypothetical protein
MYVCTELINLKPMLIFWVVTSCGLVGRYQQDVNVPPKRRYLPTSQQGITIQKNNIDIFTALRTSDLSICDSFFRLS